MVQPPDGIETVVIPVAPLPQPVPLHDGSWFQFTSLLTTDTAKRIVCVIFNHRLCQVRMAGEIGRVPSLVVEGLTTIECS